MDGNELRLGRVSKQVTVIGGVLLLVAVANVSASEEQLDPEFLEWLGQTAEVEELGVDVDKWLISNQQDSDKQDAAEKSL